MGVRLLHSLCIYVIFYVIFVPRYQFGEQGSTWWPVINFYSSSPFAVALTTGNYVAGHPCHHKESHTFDWYESLPIYYRSQTYGRNVVHQLVRLQSSFEFQDKSFLGFKVKGPSWGSIRTSVYSVVSFKGFGTMLSQTGPQMETFAFILHSNFVNKL